MPLTLEQRNKICKAAKRAIGTPYKATSCLVGKRGGFDCGQLIRWIFTVTGHLPKEIPVPQNYSVHIGQHVESEEYVRLVSQFFDEIPEADVLPGDIVVFRLMDSKAYCHAALIVEYPRVLIHCIKVYGVQGADSKMPMFKGSARKFFRLREEFVKEQH